MEEDAEVMDYVDNGLWNTSKLQEVLQVKWFSSLLKTLVHLQEGTMLTKLGGW